MAGLPLARSTLWLALAVGGCAGDGGDAGVPGCTDKDLRLDTCALAFQPTFENVYVQVLEPTCRQQGGFCHGEADADGAVGGLVLTDMDTAHDNLLSLGLVVPGDPACSEVVVRLETDQASLRMPPGGTALDAKVRCSVEQWIAQGAPR